ncbi:MAG: hypothetical protein COV52_05780 [Gammaproteobacteria bacterium CG11_big_fil_rev_8_21_14_0_20_46_22]|nr:MAG: hypothetical protein COW05_07880 [Gammaproteobacteria bacterium CG12_big_fil_rev_8_21_14_0_65_46_12]PIR11015.1 MAG: hypothetical protein COV52_05780 [Gammaproteobacteria bacterium CG11_big_fil_rev_8_21_14_0_20_46_22]
MGVIKMFEGKKIAIVLPERLGDTLFNTPSIEFIKHYYPNCHIDAICLSPVTAAVIENNPHIGQYFIKPHRKQCAKLKNDYDHFLFLSDYEHYFPEYIRWLAPNTLVLENMKHDAHLAEQKLRFLSELCDKPMPDYLLHYFLYPSDSDEHTIAAELKHLGINKNESPVIGLHLGCRRIAKRWLWSPKKDRFTHKKVWAMENFITLAHELTKQIPSLRFIVTGTKAEGAMIKEFCKAVPNAINFANKTSVLQAAALMKHLTLYLACDTGTTHIAYAMQTPTVVLFGPTNLNRFGPFPKSANNHVVQGKTISDIQIEAVKSAVKNALGH